ncbi:hypothetical protein [Desulfovibrio sp. ZJ200]|uniref:hypothetical protein n=1 Tax=Desulfovibrio sp. ZJ200 TaxID=2709792 RepID=UPI0013EC494F|nr:hypothetical protein [Desulfovibrio sp. ZJ200]
MSFHLSAFAMYSCPEAPPKAFPLISHKHEKPKERRQGQGCEAPEGLDLDRAAAFGNVPRLDGPEGRLGNVLQGPDKSFSIQEK